MIDHELITSTPRDRVIYVFVQLRLYLTNWAFSLIKGLTEPNRLANWAPRQRGGLLRPLSEWCTFLLSFVWGRPKMPTTAWFIAWFQRPFDLNQMVLANWLYLEYIYIFGLTLCFSTWGACWVCAMILKGKGGLEGRCYRLCLNYINRDLASEGLAYAGGRWVPAGRAGPAVVPS